MDAFDEYVSDASLDFYLKQQGYNPNAVSEIIKVYRDALNFIDHKTTKDNDEDGQDDLPPVVGDFVQWVSMGVDQFVVPKKVRAIEVDWLFVEGETTGIKMNEVSVVGGASGDQNAPPQMSLPQVEVEFANPFKGEDVFMASVLSKSEDNPVSFRLLVKGDIGVSEIGKLIKLLEAQKMILED